MCKIELRLTLILTLSLSLSPPPTSPMLRIIVPFRMLHTVSGTSSLLLSVSLIPVSLSLTQFLRLSHHLFLLIRHSSNP